MRAYIWSQKYQEEWKMIQDSDTQSENQYLQHENRNEISENWAREVQFWIEADNQFNMIIKRWK